MPRRSKQASAFIVLLIVELLAGGCGSRSRWESYTPLQWEKLQNDNWRAVAADRHMNAPTVSECRDAKPDYLFICTLRWPDKVDGRRPGEKVEKTETVAYVMDAPESDSYSEKTLSQTFR